MPNTATYYRQADPALNAGFRRWPAPATGDDFAPIRVWHADDLPPAPLSRKRREAEAMWARITRRAP